MVTKVPFTGYFELPDGVLVPPPAPEPTPDPEPDPTPDPDPPTTEWLTWDSPPAVLVPGADVLKVGPGLDAENIWALRTMNIDVTTKIRLFGGTNLDAPLWYRGYNTRNLPKGAGADIAGFGPVRPVIRSVTDYPLNPAEIAAGMTPENVESFWECLIWQFQGGSVADINFLGGPRRRDGHAVGAIRAYRGDFDWTVERCGFRDCMGGPYSSGNMKKITMRQLDINGHASSYLCHGLYLPGNPETNILIEACTFRMGRTDGNHIHTKAGTNLGKVVVRNNRTTEFNSPTSGFLRAGPGVVDLTVENNYVIADKGHPSAWRVDYKAPYDPKPMKYLRIAGNTFDQGGLANAAVMRLYTTDLADLAETLEVEDNTLIGFDPNKVLLAAVDGGEQLLPLPGHALAA